MTKRIIELRAGEGGIDAQTFVAELAKAYLACAHREGWTARAVEAPDTRIGHQTLTILVDGNGAEKLDNEIGGHRIQRVPKSERNGRVHSSTVTVAIMRDVAVKTVFDRRQPDDFKIDWFNGTIGAGGQNHQKTACCARVTHIPTGLVKTAQTRSRANSLKNALEALYTALDEQSGQRANQTTNAVRKAYVGTGMRSDKRRTLQFQHGIVTDHITGRKAPLKLVMNGRFDLLW